MYIKSFCCCCTNLDLYPEKLWNLKKFDTIVTQPGFHNKENSQYKLPTMDKVHFSAFVHRIISVNRLYICKCWFSVTKQLGNKLVCGKFVQKTNSLYKTNLERWTKKYKYLTGVQESPRHFHVNLLSGVVKGPALKDPRGVLCMNLF